MGKQEGNENIAENKSVRCCLKHTWNNVSFGSFQCKKEISQMFVNQLFIRFYLDKSGPLYWKIGGEMRLYLARENVFKSIINSILTCPVFK